MWFLGRRSVDANHNKAKSDCSCMGSGTAFLRYATRNASEQVLLSILAVAASCENDHGKLSNRCRMLMITGSTDYNP
jgi:hypothetical protein